MIWVLLYILVGFVLDNWIDDGQKADHPVLQFTLIVVLWPLVLFIAIQTASRRS